MNDAYLLMGANLGDRQEQLNQALVGIEESCGKLVDRSSLYETAPWGDANQDDFLNQVIMIKTVLPAGQLLKEILAIENRMGRVRTVKNGPRTIDIDILFFNHAVIHEKELVIPHPELPNRRFALEPMNEIAPAYIHPVTYKTIRQLLDECPDTLPVKKILST